LVAELQKPGFTPNTPVLGEFPITLTVNGVEHTLYIEPRVTLLDALRERLGFTGTKKGCNHGQCGACTVLVNGQRINSCLTLAVMQVGREITTIEGIAHDNKLHPLQAAFIEYDAFQCGYCTSGQICSAIGLLNEGHAQTDAEVQELMSGNLCRCGAYPNILAAIQDVRTQMSIESSSEPVKACYPPVISFDVESEEQL
jgi:xanthine dehydrogenase YagT iron-sulfur-binding subunit